MAKLIIFNKPYKVLSQFTTDSDKPTLADYVSVKQVYPAGRLDFDSEGLLLLTDNGQLQAHISDPRHKLTKTYWVQVEGQATEDHCKQLCRGVELKDGPAAALSCELLAPPPTLGSQPAYPGTSVDPRQLASHYHCRGAQSAGTADDRSR